MNEFLGSTMPFDTIPTEETRPVIDRYARIMHIHSEYADDQDADTSMEWLDIRKHALGYILLTKVMTLNGSNLLYVREQVRSTEPRNFSQTDYFLDTDTGAFVVSREDFGAARVSEIEEELESRIQAHGELMFELGGYRPRDTDWAEFIELVAKSEVFALKMLELKANEEQAERTAAVAVARELLERAFANEAID